MNMNTDNRVSPQAPEIEEAILGACLIEQEAMPLVADTLRPEMFYSMRHQVIYAALLAMYLGFHLLGVGGMVLLPVLLLLLKQFQDAGVIHLWK